MSMYCTHIDADLIMLQIKQENELLIIDYLSKMDHAF
jgi:hypothetical protein